MPKKKVESMPEGKFAGLVKVGEKGQIVIPKPARDLFDIQPGETLLLLADINQGIAIMKNDLYRMFAGAMMDLQAKEEADDAQPDEPDQKEDAE